MGHKSGVSFWAFLIWATMVHAQQLGPPSFVAKAFASQTPRDSSDQKPNEGKPNEGKPNEGKPNEGKPNEGKPNEKSTLSAQINGRVVDRNGKGLANSEVTIAGPKIKRKTTTTNSTGSFSFEGSAGRYTITAKAGGKSKSIETEVGNESLELPPLILELDP